MPRSRHRFASVWRSPKSSGIAHPPGSFPKMSVPVKNPTYLAGTPRSSGDVQAGEVVFTRGGGRASCVWSGSLLTNAALTAAPGAVQSGGHILLFSGAGRLNTVVVHQFIGSGQPVFFYDAGTIAPSGVSVSGQKIIGIIPATMPAVLTTLSGSFQMGRTWNDVMVLDMPFQSGLCAGAASGSPGFTASFIPEVPYPG